MIGEHDFASFFIECPKCLSEFGLHISTKCILVVAREICSLCESIVWRIEIDEVAFLCFCEDTLEALKSYLCFCLSEKFRGIADVGSLDEVGVFVGTHWHIEFSTTIHTVETIEACTIEIDKTTCSLDARMFLLPVFYSVPCSDSFVAFFGMFECREKCDEFFWRVFDCLISIDEFFVDVREIGFLFLEIEKHSTTSEKWFKIVTKFGWKELLELFDKLSLASDPFYKRASLDNAFIFSEKCFCFYLIRESEIFAPRFHNPEIESEAIRNALEKNSGHIFILKVS